MQQTPSRHGHPSNDTTAHNIRSRKLNSVRLEGFTAVNILLFTGKVVLSPPILITLMMKAIRSSETSPVARAIRRNIPENSVLYLRSALEIKDCKIIYRLKFV
jgi:hypothetical protein